jgi:hypothetical protein
VALALPNLQAIQNLKIKGKKKSPTKSMKSKVNEILYSIPKFLNYLATIEENVAEIEVS